MTRDKLSQRRGENSDYVSHSASSYKVPRVDRDHARHQMLMMNWNAAMGTRRMQRPG